MRCCHCHLFAHVMGTTKLTTQSPAHSRSHTVPLFHQGSSTHIAQIQNIYKCFSTKWLQEGSNDASRLSDLGSLGFCWNAQNAYSGFCSLVKHRLLHCSALWSSSHTPCSKGNYCISDPCLLSWNREHPHYPVIACVNVLLFILKSQTEGPGSWKGIAAILSCWNPAHNIQVTAEITSAVTAPLTSFPCSRKSLRICYQHTKYNQLQILKLLQTKSEVIFQESPMHLLQAAWCLFQRSDCFCRTELLHKALEAPVPERQTAHRALRTHKSNHIFMI